MTHRPTRARRRPALGRARALGAVAAFAALAASAALPAAAQPAPAPPAGDALVLTVGEAVALALEKNEGIVVERLALDSAERAIDGARGAYDPLLALSGGYRETTAPVNSAFSGAPEGRLAPTEEVADAAAALTQLLPTGGVVSARAGNARNETDGAFGLLSPAYGSQLGAEIRQPLLRGREIDPARLQLRVAAADRDRAAAALRREVIETVAAVERAYWTLVAARRAVEVRADALGLAEEQLEETGYRVEAGASPETEIAQPRAERERRRGDLYAAREAVARAENDLKLLILDDADDALWTRPLAPAAPDAIERVAIDVAAAMARALELRTELEAAEALLERRRAEADFARDRVKPELDLVLSYDRFGLAGSRNPRSAPIPGLLDDVPPGLEGNLGDSLEQLVDGEFDDARIALVFELPIGNRTARAAAAQAENTTRQAEAETARLRKAIRAEVLDAAAALETAGQRIEATGAAREAAQVQLDAERERFSVGLSTNFLVLTRQNDLESARLAEIEARTDYRRAQTEMARAVGTLLDERDVRIEDPRDTP